MKEHVREVNVGMKLQGYLLGYEVLQNGIVVQHYDYPVPVKNTVVNVGKAALLYHANLHTISQITNTVQFGGMYGIAEAGALYYCGRGSGTTAATVNDTSLETAIGNKTNTFLSGDPNTGTRYDRENGKIIMRVTHDHENESSDQNINEIGYFGKRNNIFVMFSRIVLPSTITVLTGQQLRTIYQLEVQVSPYTSTPSAPSITGWTTDGYVRFEGLFPETSTVFGSTPNDFISAITNTGTAAHSLVYCAALQPSVTNESSFDTIVFRGSPYTFNSFGTDLTVPSASSTVYTRASSGTITTTVGSITSTQTYRDITFEFGPNWTGYPSIDIYSMTIRGLTHIFDSPVTKTNTQRLTIVYRVSVS